MAKFLTTNTLIEDVVRRAMIPESQSTFKEKDFLAFANQEMDLGVVPHILSFHEDYLLFPLEVTLDPNINRYAIPSRAIGNKLRDVFYKDTSGTLFELTRIMVEDSPYFQYGYGGNSSSSLRAFYVQGNEIVLMPNVDYYGPIGKLKFFYYNRPNELVSEDRVTSITSVDYNKGILKVNNIPDVFSGELAFDITSSKSPFRLVGMEVVPNDYASTSNLTYTFGTSKKTTTQILPKASYSVGSYLQVIDSTNSIKLTHAFWLDLSGSDPVPSIVGAIPQRVDISSATTADDVSNAIASQMNLILNPTIVASNSSGVLHLDGGGNSISVGDNFSIYATFGPSVIVSPGTNTLPSGLNKNDIMALPEETSIPQIPSELQSMLSQRTAMRCLEALGDAQGLQMAAAKLQEMEQKTGSLIDSRVEGAPLKVTNRHSLLYTNNRYIRR